jgi:hypothetical protein
MNKVKSFEKLQGIVEALFYANTSEIETEKNLDITAHVCSVGEYKIQVSFTDYLTPPKFKGDHLQPADENVEHRSTQVFFVSAETKVHKVCKDILCELERIEELPTPEVNCKKDAA